MLPQNTLTITIWPLLEIHPGCDDDDDEHDDGKDDDDDNDDDDNYDDVDVDDDNYQGTTWWTIRLVYLELPSCLRLYEQHEEEVFVKVVIIAIIIIIVIVVIWWTISRTQFVEWSSWVQLNCRHAKSVETSTSALFGFQRLAQISIRLAQISIRQYSNSRQNSIITFSNLQKWLCFVISQDMHKLAEEGKCWLLTPKIGTSVPANKTVPILCLYRPELAQLCYSTVDNCAGWWSSANFVHGQTKN